MTMKNSNYNAAYYYVELHVTFPSFIVCGELE